ncbi:uncharacterized protein DNG_06802 [Cephalotrichum gorgonifer]|uniref:Uncharacterized protein n=1 Tax=Cephalotrichum gorgonifer TaxID=2041049 RepID=A0AAE8N2B1_9PEZI|nr:uncharacterized protein DNG_06802 [Cephalotrichum gorgonifer]
MAPPSTTTVSGTPLTFLPVFSTPWPQPSDCDNTYRRPDGTLLAWDIVYGISFSSEAQTCWPPEFTSSWEQSPTAATYTVFGPTFECPASYEAVQTAIVGEGVQRVFCCPSSYSLRIPQPISSAWPSQCVSVATSGQVLSYMNQYKSKGVFYGVPTSSTVNEEDVTVYGAPVNGFNVAATDANGNLIESDKSHGMGVPTRIIVGAAVGSVGGLALIFIGAWIIWRRRRSARASGGGPAPDALGEGAPGQAAGRDPVKGKVYAELSTDTTTSQVYELPAQARVTNG